MPLLGDGARSRIESTRRGKGASPAFASSAWEDADSTGRGSGNAGVNAGTDAGAVTRALPNALPDGLAGNLGGSLGSILSSCANPNCATGWLHLWRSRSAPVFEGGWSCSAACTLARVEIAVRREMEGRIAEPAGHRHRVPLGLVMLEQGWITSEQLRRALEAQKSSGEGKLGEWLVRQQGVEEQRITRALSLQWNCPVLPLDFHDPETMAPALPRLFVEAFGVLPLRVAAGKILYLGFEERLDPALALAVERMLGLRVEAGLVRGSLFAAAHRRMLESGFPRIELIETGSQAPVARVMARAIERSRPVESRLVRLHDCLWLRMWLRPQISPLPTAAGVEDLVCSLISG